MPERQACTRADRIESMEARLFKLERSIKFWRRTGLVSITVLILASAAGLRGGDPKQIEAESFVVRDGQGKVRAGLGLQADGTVSFTLGDQQAHPIVAVTADRRGSATLQVYDSAQKARVLLSSDNGGSSSLQLIDPSDGSMLNLSMGGARRVPLMLGDSKGPRFTLSADDKWNPSLNFRGTDGSVLDVGNNGTSSRIVAADARDQIRFAVAANGDGTAGVSVRDSQQRERIVIGLDAAGTPSIGLLDAQGVPKFRAP